MFIFTMTDSTKNDSGSMKPMLTKLLKNCIAVMKDHKSGMIHDHLLEFLMDLKIKAIDSRKIELDEEILRQMPTESPNLLKRTMSNLFSNLFKQPRESKKSINLISVFRKTMHDKAKNENVIVSEKNDHLHRTFKDIVNQAYFEEYSEDELESLQYHEESNKTKVTSTQKMNKFEGFLKGIINHIQPENDIEKNIQLLGLQMLTSYIKYYETTKNPMERKNRQQFLFGCHLDKLLCKLVSTSNDDEVVFYSLYTAQSLLELADHDEQLSFKESIVESSSYSFLHTPQVFIKDYLSKLEKDLIVQQKHNLLFTMFGEANPQDDVDTSTHLKYQKSVSSYFIFLRLMCEGKNTGVQNFMRAQNSVDARGEKVRNINIIFDSCEYLKTITRFINKVSIQIIIDILRLLTECILGPCVENQQELLSYQILDNIREILTEINRNDTEGLKIKGLISTDEESNCLMDRCFDSIIELLLALIEANTKKELLQEIVYIFPFDSFITRLTKVLRHSLPRTVIKKADYYEQFTVEQVIRSFSKPVFSQEMQVAFNLFFLLKIIGDNCSHYANDIEGLVGEQKFVYDFFMYCTQSIEIVFRGSILKQYFVKYPACNYLSDQSMKSFMGSVNRDTPNQKVTDFVQRSAAMFNEMDYSFSLKKKLKIDATYSWNLRIAALITCYILNLYFLVVSENKIQGSDWSDDDHKYSEGFVTSVAIIYLVISGFSIILFCLDTVQIERINNWSAYIRQMKTISNLTIAEKDWIQTYIDRDIIELKKEDYYTLIDFKRKKEGSRYTVPWITKLANDLMFIDSQLFLMMFYWVCFIGGMSTKNNWLYSIPLLDTMVFLT